MKKLCVLIIAAVVLIANFAVTANEYDLSVRYDVAPKVIITGRIGTAAGAVVTVLISPYSDPVPPFASDTLPLIADYFTTGEEGLIFNEIILPANISAGVYTVYFSSGAYGKAQKNFIVFDQTSEAYASALNKVNIAASKAETVDILSSKGIILGVDVTRLTSQEIESDAALLFAWRKLGGNYNAQSFSEACSAAEAVRLLKAGDSLLRVLTNYSASFGASLSEYQALPDFQKIKLEEHLKDTDFSKNLPNAVYAEAFIVTRVAGAASWADAKDATLLYQAELELPMADYNALPSQFKKDEAFMNFYARLPGCDAFAKIKTAFVQAIASVSGTGNSGSIYKPSGGGSGNGNASGSESAISSSTNILAPPPEEFPNAVSSMFTDIDGHFSKDAVEVLCEKGIVSGYPDGSFKPDGSVSRAEFSKMVVLAFGITGEVENSFYDVSVDDWFCTYINLLAQKGIMTGYDGYAMPGGRLTRQDAATIIYRLSGIRQPDCEADYADADSISDYAKNAVAALSERKLLRGDGINFHPQSPMTRGEVAVFLLRVMSENY